MLSGTTTRRDLLRGTGMLALGVAAAACAPAASAPPAQPGSAGAAPGKAAWEQEWERTIAAARQEGTLNLLTLSGAGFRKGMEAFQAAYPGIHVEHQSFSSASLLIPKVIQERQANVFAWDVANTSITSMMGTLKPTGAFDPLRPLIVLPGIDDEKMWHEGFNYNFVDNDQKLAFNFAGELNRLWANYDLIKEGEIKSVKDLLDPKWKGKVLWIDVRNGSTFGAMWGIRTTLGDDAVKRLLIDQEPGFTRERRQVAEAAVRGRYPIVCGLAISDLREFQAEGLGKNVKPLQLPEAETIVSGGGLFYFNRAPHPNAAKLFINWLLSKEGQTAWCQAQGWNSRRVDVPPSEPELMPTPGVKYLNPQHEARMAAQDEVRIWIEQFAR